MAREEQESPSVQEETIDRRPIELLRAKIKHHGDEIDIPFGD